MKNTTKLKNILQLYLVQLDMDDDGNFIFTLRDKRTGAMETYTDKSYSVVIAKAFGYMKREMKFKVGK
jgi:predicted RNA-binding protein (virulence factor B family)